MRVFPELMAGLKLKVFRFPPVQEMVMTVRIIDAMMIHDESVLPCEIIGLIVIADTFLDVGYTDLL